MFLTVAQVCEQLQLSERKVRELIARGDLAAYKFDGAIRIKESDLKAYTDTCLIPQQAPAQKKRAHQFRCLRLS